VSLILELLRHGQAVSHAPGGDADRALTPAGTAAVRRLGERLAAEGWRPDRVFSSPYVRALETVRAVLGEPAGILVEPLAELTPEVEPDTLIEMLEVLEADHGRILLVAHQPLLGRLATRLTGVDTALGVGELVRIECPSGLTPGNGKILSRM